MDLGLKTSFLIPRIVLTLLQFGYINWKRSGIFQFLFRLIEKEAEFMYFYFWPFVKYPFHNMFGMQQKQWNVIIQSMIFQSFCDLYKFIFIFICHRGHALVFKEIWTCLSLSPYIKILVAVIMNILRLVKNTNSVLAWKLWRAFSYYLSCWRVLMRIA